MPHRTNGHFPWEKNKKMTAAGYARDLDATCELPYGEKFAEPTGSRRSIQVSEASGNADATGR